MMTLPPTEGAWTPDALPAPPEALAAVAAIRQLLAALGADPAYVRRVAAWTGGEGTQAWVYVPALPLPVAERLAALGGVA
jgi:hypothetical protein